MAKKFEIVGQSLVITDESIPKVLFDFPKSEVYYDSALLINEGIIKINNIDALDNAVVSASRVLLTDAVDGTGTPFTESTFISFARTNLGFKTASGGSGATASDLVYSALWNANTDAPSKNAVYDKIEALVISGGGETEATIKTKYESNADTNAFTDAEKTAVANNSAKVGITPTQAANIVTNNSKVSFDSTSSTRLANTSGSNTGDQTIPVTGVDFDAVGTDNSDNNAVNTLYSGLEASKQDTLVSGTNIKTINGESLLGATDIVITGAAASDLVYSALWNANTDAASKNAIYDKIESVIAGVGTGATPVIRTSAGETTWNVGSTITASHKLYVDGTKMVEGTDYTQTGSTFTFTGYTATTSDIQEYYPDIAVPTVAQVASSGTGTVISLDNPLGYYGDMTTANTATTYTTTGTTLGAFAVIRINAATQPAITGATLLTGATFAASTDMHMVVQYFGVTVQYYFIAL
jgi:hypothetical protein